MSNTNVLRNNLKQVYKSKEWAKKVDAMSEAQVIAITRRLQMQGKL